MSDQTPNSPVGDAPDFDPPAAPSSPPGAPEVQVGNVGEETQPASEEHVLGVAPGNTAADDPYLGTDPVYQNHANDTETPYQVEVDADSPEDVARAAYVEATAEKNFEEAQAAGQNLGIQGFTVPAVPEPPRTVEEIVAYNEDKARRMEAAREEAAKNPAPRF